MARRPIHVRKRKPMTPTPPAVSPAVPKVTAFTISASGRELDDGSWAINVDGNINGKSMQWRGSASSMTEARTKAQKATNTLMDRVGAPEPDAK